MQVEPAAQVVLPVYPIPPHCPHTGTDPPGGAVVVVTGPVVVCVVVVVVIGVVADSLLLMNDNATDPYSVP